MIIILYKLLVNKPTPVLPVPLEIQLAHVFLVCIRHHTDVGYTNHELVEFFFWFCVRITVHSLQWRAI